MCCFVHISHRGQGHGGAGRRSGQEGRSRAEEGEKGKNSLVHFNLKEEYTNFSVRVRGNCVRTRRLPT